MKKYKFMNKGKKPESFHKRWTEADDQQLAELVKKGANATEISKKMGRTRSSIYGRKFTLEIEGTITKTPHGEANALTWATKNRSSVEQPKQEVIQVQEEPVAIKKERKKREPKQIAEPKEKTTKKVVPYTFKLAQYCLRRRRGDFAKVAQITGYTNTFVKSVLDGNFVNERIVNVAYNMTKARKPFII